MVTKKIDLAKPGHQVIDVTPALAEGWLKLNKHNRKFKPMKISHYARDMREGNWKYTGEALKFSTWGELIDGQNRLQAIIDAETTVSLPIVTGLDPSAQEVMDAGAPRNAGDTLAFRGYGYPSELSAATRSHYMWKEMQNWKHCMSSSNSELMPTNAEIVRYVEDHPDLVTVAGEAKPIAQQLRLPIGSIGAAWYEFLQIDAEDTEEFFKRIHDIQTTGKGDPINTLVKRCQEMALRRERLLQSTGLFMIIRTWNAVRASEYFEKFQFGSAVRGWQPIPEPK